MKTAKFKGWHRKRDHMGTRGTFTRGRIYQVVNSCPDYLQCLDDNQVKMWELGHNFHKPIIEGEQNDTAS